MVPRRVTRVLVGQRKNPRTRPWSSVDDGGGVVDVSLGAGHECCDEWRVRCVLSEERRRYAALDNPIPQETSAMLTQTSLASPFPMIGQRALRRACGYQCRSGESR
jgi:hypothetical protein